jgi:serine phosphatase RsbU (regulator of sigma subunit)/anti-sigma regulatory factor (Ser/Thr protein kinase)
MRDHAPTEARKMAADRHRWSTSGLAAHSADHAARLQEVTAGLAAAATTSEIADVVITHGIPALSARTGILGVLEEQDELRFLRSVGYGDVFPERLSLDEPWPITAAVRTRTIVELRDVVERRAEYAVPERVWEASGQGTLVAVPLLIGSRPVGALGFTREDRRPLSADERGLVETLANQAALALERAVLFEADHRARVQAEGLQRVASAVARASTMGDVATAVASEALAVLDASGVTVVLARASDPSVGDVLASRGLAAEHARSEPTVNLTGNTITAQSVRLAEPVYAESEQELESGSPDSARVADSFGVRGIASLPLVVGERRGAFSVLLSESRRFHPEERRFLELLARLCEQGLLRASLFEAEQAARTRADALRALAATLSGAVAVSEVGSAFLDSALRLLTASSGALLLVDDERESLNAVSVGGASPSRDLWLPSIPVDDSYVTGAAFRQAASVAASTREELEARFPGTASGFGASARSAYAGPLSFGDATIGAFGLVFEDERRVSVEDQRLLETMGDLCAQAIGRARSYETEHQIAYRLQQAMLPPGVIRHPGVEVAASYHAGTEEMVIGGDWYDTVSLPDGRIGLVVGDVVGQGIEAAATMGRLRSALAAYALYETSSAELMARLNHFGQSVGRVEFATACFVVLDPESGALTYTSAGHPPPLLVAADGTSRFLTDGSTQPLYGSTSFDPVEATADLQPGDLLLLYSDGLVERRGEHIETGLARLDEAARSLRDEPVHEICATLAADLRPAVEHADDIVILVVRRKRAARAVFERVFPARPEELRIVRAEVRAWLHDQDLSQSDREAVVLALGEACANAVEHAYVEGRAGEMSVELSMLDDSVVVAVRDSGSWRAVPHDDPDRGRGYEIMRSLSDRVDVESGPDGTIVTMYLPRGVDRP